MTAPTITLDKIAVGDSLPELAVEVTPTTRRARRPRQP